MLCLWSLDATKNGVGRLVGGSWGGRGRFFLVLVLLTLKNVKRIAGFDFWQIDCNDMARVNICTVFEARMSVAITVKESLLAFNDSGRHQRTAIMLTIGNIPVFNCDS